MDKALGLLLLVVYISAIVGLAAGVTFAVVKIFPTERTPKKPDKPEAADSAGNADSGGSMFRRSKRASA